MKLKYRLIEKLANLTNKELEFLLYVARFQDEHGRIEGVYYGDVCRKTGMCKQTFYASLRALERKGIIRYFHVEQDYDITILDNDFSYPESFQEGYVMLNRKVFRSTGFRLLKAKEKYMLLDLMKITHSNRGLYVTDRTRFYGRYQGLLKVSFRVIRYYLQTLKKYFRVTLTGGKYQIAYRAEQFEKTVESGKAQAREYTAEMILRRAGVKEKRLEDVQDIAGLLKQYAGAARERRLEIWRLLLQVVRASMKEQGQDRRLRIKRIHMLLKECLA